MPERAPRYGIGEWYGQPVDRTELPSLHALADTALHGDRERPCPFQEPGTLCKKKGGVCSLRLFNPRPGGRGWPQAHGASAVVCPKRFEQDSMVVRWLAEILGYPAPATELAREVPFMRSVTTTRSAGKIDLVVAYRPNGRLQWCALEIQAVYFSGPAMSAEFENMAAHTGPDLPFPSPGRRPDWRSSSAKRLLPQLEVKVPTIRRWGAKMAVAVDPAFFKAVGGPADEPSHDINDGDIIWLVPELVPDSGGGCKLRRGHWEVQTLEMASHRLLAAETVPRADFEASLQERLRPVDGAN